MTAPCRSLEQLADQAGCPSANQPRHRLDCLVRQLIQDLAQVNQPAPPGEPWQRALALGLDPTAEQLVIQAGIGWLRITPTAFEWRPVQTRSAPASPPPASAPDALTAARLATCRACSRYVDHRCQVAGCGCSGLGNPAAQFSKCPLGRWEP